MWGCRASATDRGAPKPLTLPSPLWGEGNRGQPRAYSRPHARSVIARSSSLGGDSARCARWRRHFSDSPAAGGSCTIGREGLHAASAVEPPSLAVRDRGRNSARPFGCVRTPPCASATTTHRLSDQRRFHRAHRGLRRGAHATWLRRGPRHHHRKATGPDEHDRRFGSCRRACTDGPRSHRRVSHAVRARGA